MTLVSRWRTSLAMTSRVEFSMACIEAMGSTAGGFDEFRPEANALEYVLAETIARGSGGSLTIDTSDAQESLILLELRTPT